MQRFTTPPAKRQTILPSGTTTPRSTDSPHRRPLQRHTSLGPTDLLWRLASPIRPADSPRRRPLQCYTTLGPTELPWRPTSPARPGRVAPRLALPILLPDMPCGLASMTRFTDLPKASRPTSLPYRLASLTCPTEPPH
eukprot:350017-Chlamydomonas_euryale.AAC.2